jgi:hypothetical protein
MATEQEMRDRIAEIDTILQSGVNSNAVDGESTSFNHETLRQERQALKVQVGDKKKRHRVFNFNMGGG